MLIAGAGRGLGERLIAKWTVYPVRGLGPLINENPRMGVRGSLGRGGWMGGLTYSPRKKSSGFSLIVRPSAHVSELSDPFKRHRMNHWPTLSRITSYPRFFQCTALPASTASLISLSFISGANLPHHHPGGQGGKYRTMKISVNPIRIDVYGPIPDF